MPSPAPMPEYIDQSAQVPQAGVEGSMKQAFKTPIDGTAPKKPEDEEKSYMQMLKDMAAGYSANKQAPAAQAPMPAYIQQPPAITAQPASFTQGVQGMQQMGARPPQVDPQNAAAMRGAFRGR